jgi:hypothetical protein
MKLVLILIFLLSIQLVAEDAKQTSNKPQVIITSEGPFPTLFIPSNKISPAEKQAKQAKAVSEKNSGSLTYMIAFPGTRQLARDPSSGKGLILNISAWLLLANIAVQSVNLGIAQKTYNNSQGLTYLNYMVIQRFASSPAEAKMVTDFLVYDSASEFGKLRQDYTGAAQNTTLAIGLFVGLYALNIIDLIAFSKPTTSASSNHPHPKSGLDFQTKVENFPVVSGNSYANNRETNYTLGWRHVW